MLFWVFRFCFQVQPGQLSVHQNCGGDGYWDGSVLVIVCGVAAATKWLILVAASGEAEVLGPVENGLGGELALGQDGTKNCGTVSTSASASAPTSALSSIST